MAGRHPAAAPAAAAGQRRGRPAGHRRARLVRRDSGLVAGYCGLLLRPAKGVTLGYAITAGQRGQGFAAEAAGALLAWAEQRHPGVYASIRPPNPASERVLKKIGMRLSASYTDEDGVRNVYRRRPG